jgi:hypothetical protein
VEARLQFWHRNGRQDRLLENHSIENNFGAIKTILRDSLLRSMGTLAI